MGQREIVDDDIDTAGSGKMGFYILAPIFHNSMSTPQPDRNVKNVPRFPVKRAIDPIFFYFLSTIKNCQLHLISSKLKLKCHI
jgi:hypothetical protein